jgi:hypothetical protein
MDVSESKHKPRKEVNEMQHHHDARYPFLFIQSTEEDRIIRENRAKFDEDVQFYSWDIAAGYQAMVRNGGGAWAWRSISVPGFEPKGGNGKIVDPGMALEATGSLPIKYDESCDPPRPIGAMIFMKDYHKYFEKITITRAALNLKSNLKLQAKTICFISAEKIIPPELADDVTVVDYAYPDEAALLRIVEKMAEDNEMEVPENVDTIVNAMRGLTWEGAENALALSLVMKGCFDVKTILEQKAAQMKATGVLEFGHYTETLDEIFGLERLKRNILSTIKSPKARGVLIFGIPGSGKSHIAKAVANEMEIPCLILRFSALKDRYQGVAEGRLRDAFKTIRAVGKCVVFMDEIEAIASGISSGGDSGVGQSLFKELLREMEDSRGCGAYWIGTCNALEPLIQESGGALLRRFGGIFFTDLPSAEEARGIAGIWEKKEGVLIPKNFSLDGYSGADIAKLAETISMMGCSAEEASDYVLPYGKAHAEKLEEIRTKARGVCIWASDKPAGGKVQSITDSGRKVKKGRKVA